MKIPILTLVLGVLPCLATLANPLNPVTSPGKLTVTEIHYEAKLADEEARFNVHVEAEATGPGASSVTLLSGDVAVLPVTNKPGGQLRIVRTGSNYLLSAPRAGHYQTTLQILAKIQHADSWNQISFAGPAATISSLTAQAAGTNIEVQLLAGTLLVNSQTNGISALTGYLGADSMVALRWQNKVAAVARKALLTVDASIAAQATPTVIRYTTRFHYTTLQGAARQLLITLPAAQALTHLDGGQIRDWHLATASGRQTLTIEFIKPLETNYDLTLYSEQARDGTSDTAILNPPQTQDTDRESGTLVVFTEDMMAEVTAAEGLRQENAADNAVVAYRFSTRPFTLSLKLKPMEPLITTTDRISGRLEETRLVIIHHLDLQVDKAGIYTLDLTPATGFTVGEVQGAGIEDWDVQTHQLHLNFSSRVIGARAIEVQLEQSFKNFPDHITIAPLAAPGAANETAQIGVSALPGLRLKTGELAGLREIPINALANRTDEILAFTAEQANWQVVIACERLAPRIVADIFNLTTVADGVVGGSATIRYGLMNQGVQEFHVHVPPEYKNVEFTGPNIRTKEQAGDTWTIGLQDKVWGGFTLVVTYDYQFDGAATTLPLGGIHALDIERETGSIAVTTAASLQLSPQGTGETLHRVDEGELAPTDRALITRAVVAAWQYTGDQYDLHLAVQRFAQVPVLEAVADRTQITSVLTESGEMLTQASFMVKNNEKQFQRFQLPPDSHLWSCYVNGLPAKPQRDEGWVLVPLLRDANRDQAFAVDIVYAQTNGVLASTFGKKLELTAPRTDIANSYAEWQLFVPSALRLSAFGGSMAVTQGTTYELFDAWHKFLSFYGQVLREAGGALFFFFFLALLVFGLVISAVRNGWNGILTLLGVIAILFILAAMLLPALSAAKRKAQVINSVNNLKQIGIATRIFSGDNADRLPTSFEEMSNELGTQRITYDPSTGQRYTYLGAGMSADKLKPESVVCYSTPDASGRCDVLYMDGSVQTVTAQGFAELSQRGLVQVTGPQDLAEKQVEQVAQSQFALNPSAKLTQEAPPMSGLNPPAPASGVGSIRIELPQTGTPFTFTKVLNIHGDPLSISARVTTLRRFQLIQMLWQSAAFLFGLVVWWMEWRRPYRRSFILALALALNTGSVCSLLVQWRALHDALIIGFPIMVVAAIAWLVWKCWPRRRQNAPDQEALDPRPVTGAPAALAVVALTCLLGSTALASPSLNGLAVVPISAASYSGTVNDRVAQLDASLQFSAVHAGDSVPLFGNDVAIQKYSVKNGAAKLVRDDQGLSIQFQRSGEVTLQVALLATVSGDVTRRRLTFALPPALSSHISLTLAETDADVDFPSAVSFKRTLNHDQTGVEAMIGAADRLDLQWMPRVKHAEETAATVFCQDASLVTFGRGVVNFRTTLDYRVTQGELRQTRIKLPDHQKLLRVAGPQVGTWALQPENGAEVLTVDLVKGIPDQCRLVVETEAPLGQLPASLSIHLPQALDAIRESGLIALQNTDELGTSVTSADGLDRVDAADFARALGNDDDQPSTTLRFQQSKFSLQVQVAAFQPEIEAVVRNNFRVGPDQLLLSAQVDYVIKRAGVFNLQLKLPADFRVESVSGDQLQQWVEKDGSGVRVLEVSLKERVLGATALTLALVRPGTTLVPQLALEGVHPLHAAKLTGFISVAPEPGVSARADSFTNLTEVPLGSLPDYHALAGAGNVLAYKYITPAPTAVSPWKLSVTTATVASWIRAEILDTFTLTETLVNGRAQVLYDIANAPVKQLRLRVPPGAKDVEISGANLRSRAQDGDVWTLEFQSPMHGAYSLTVTWDEPRPARTGVLELTGASALGVERESGFLAISVEPPLQIKETKVQDLQRADATDLPAWAADNEAATLIYRYVRPGYQLGLDVRRFDDAELLQTIVDSAKFTSVIAADGQMMTDMSLTVRNNGRQFLEVQLPPDATVCSAFVGMQPVRPSLRAGKILLPIESSSADDGALPVEVTFVGTNAFPATRGRVTFTSPRFDAPVKNAHWEVFLPPDYNYEALRAGTMTRETGTLAEPASTSFSVLDYSLKEQENKESAKVEVQREVSEARQQLAGGNYREANANFSRAKSQLSVKTEDADVKELGEELKSAQASNLINAQKDFYLRNSGLTLSAIQPTNPSPLNANLTAEATAAGEQWTRLQQAQDISAVNVQPLRMNLPMRGQRLAFMQVLQTEVGQPMTFALYADNAKTVHWSSRLGWSLLMFMILWGAVAILSRVMKNDQWQS